MPHIGFACSLSHKPFVQLYGHWYRGCRARPRRPASAQKRLPVYTSAVLGARWQPADDVWGRPIAASYLFANGNLESAFITPTPMSFSRLIQAHRRVNRAL